MKRVVGGLFALVVAAAIASPAGAHTRGMYVSEDTLQKAFEDNGLTVGLRHEQVFDILCSGKGEPHHEPGDYDTQVETYKHFGCYVTTPRRKYFSIYVHVVPAAGKPKGWFSYTWQRVP